MANVKVQVPFGERGPVVFLKPTVLLHLSWHRDRIDIHPPGSLQYNFYKEASHEAGLGPDRAWV